MRIGMQHVSFSYERAAEVLSLNTTKTLNLSYQNKPRNIYNKGVSMHISRQSCVNYGTQN